jgi:transposase
MPNGSAGCSIARSPSASDLLDAVFAADAPAWLREVPALETLRRSWIQQYYRAGTEVRWRTTEGLPPAALFLSSPYDTEVHYAKKRSTSWIGYKVHLTETCDEGAPHLITHVETTSAPMADSDALAPIHRALAGKGLLPNVHLVDTGYTSADLLVASQHEHGTPRSGARGLSPAGARGEGVRGERLPHRLGR